jgi:electron transfer flavoprotein alpha subunit
MIEGREQEKKHDKDTWILVRHRENRLEEVTFGLAAEGRRISDGLGEKGFLTAIALGVGLKEELERLKDYGVNRVLYMEEELFLQYHGELFAEALMMMVRKYGPDCILMAADSETEDLAPRVAAMMGTALITRAVDFRILDEGKGLALRPTANDFLFEELEVLLERPPILCFLPSVLDMPEPGPGGPMEIGIEKSGLTKGNLKTQIEETRKAPPGDLDLEDADIIVAGGRGVGRRKAFGVVHKLAETLHGTVGGTRPVVDWKVLPYDRQIGQTGKTVSPRLIINCGISGANEYTAGMEKAHHVVAINEDPGARIFRFSDLGLVGDLHEILPALIRRIKEIKNA